MAAVGCRLTTLNSFWISRRPVLENVESLYVARRLLERASRLTQAKLRA